MARTALSCVLWWRWFGILVMFQGMDRHSGIRTGSQDAARTAAGHSAQDTASRDTESPGESIVWSGRVGSVRFSSGEVTAECRSFSLTFNPRHGRGFPAERCRCCPLEQRRADDRQVDRQVDREAAGVMLHSSRSASPPAAMAQFTLHPLSSAKHQPQDQSWSDLDLDLVQSQQQQQQQDLDFNHLDPCGLYLMKMMKKIGVCFCPGN
ncbi:hypothetical protein INR49_004544 [Caranx melampygus]|nr:hypothetical protein INR49_004544 [Caranx melampygus]